MVFRLMMLLLVIAGLVYIAYRLILPMRLQRNVNIGLLVGLVIAGTLFPLFMEVQHSTRDWVTVLGLISTVTIGLLSFLFSYTLIKDVFFGVFRIVGLRVKRIIVVRVLSLVIVAMSVLSTVVGYIQATTPRMEEVNILVGGDIDVDEDEDSDIDIEGFTIVQLSDLHLTNHKPKKWLDNIVEMVNEVNADLIVITGDIADIRLPDDDNTLSALADLHSKYGVFCVLGNHEYFFGKRQIEEWVMLFDDLGINLLQNENAIINYNQSNIMLAGITDNEATRFGYPPPDVATAVKTDSTVHFKILLAHQPQNVAQASKHGVNLQLSGHTHGGQFFPWNILVACVQEYFKGLYFVDETMLYVNQGTGFWGMPIRLGSHSEITVIKIITL